MMVENMIELKGQQFSMGADDGMGFKEDKEGPITKVAVSDFLVDETTVTNQRFLEFFLATGYVTDAERFGYSYVFHLLMDEITRQKYPLAAGSKHWREVPEANWRMPEGPGSSIKERMDHPVVHVSFRDAMNYADWAGKRLPTEAEWECASRGGHEQRMFPWGKKLEQDGTFHANTWQGTFPTINTKADGYLGTAPVKTFPANDYGLYQTIGNVWEWCLNPGKIDLKEFQEKESADFLKEALETINQDSLRALRGGSFLCHIDSCRRYRNAGRNSNTALSSTSNTGFRCVKDI